MKKKPKREAKTERCGWTVLFFFPRASSAFVRKRECVCVRPRLRDFDHVGQLLPLEKCQKCACCFLQAALTSLMFAPQICGVSAALQRGLAVFVSLRRLIKGRKSSHSFKKEAKTETFPQ